MTSDEIVEREYLVRMTLRGPANVMFDDENPVWIAENIADALMDGWGFPPRLILRVDVLDVCDNDAYAGSSA